MESPGSAAADSGFTLLEVLIAVVVLGLLVLGLSQGVRTGIALRQAQVQRLSDTSDLDAAMRLLRTLLSHLPPPAEGNRAAAAEGGAIFKGAADRVSFVGELPSGLGTARRAAMTLYVDTSRRLMLSWTPRRHERPLGPRPPAAETELLHGVERLELAYWKPSSPGQETGWQSQWEEADLPELIRVRVGFTGSGRRRWPDLIVAPRP